MRAVAHRWRDLVAGFCMVALGMGAIINATQDGIVLEQLDGPIYLASAISLAEGSGYRIPFGDPARSSIDFSDPTSPVVDFPPGYPWLLSIGIRLGGEPAMIVRWAAALSVAFSGLALLVFSRRRALPLWASLAAAVIGIGLSVRLAIQPASEIIYGPLLIATLITAGRYIRSGTARLWVVATLSAVLSATVRTIGLALVGTVGATVLLGPGSVARKSTRAIATAGLGLLPFGALVGAGSRIVAWHPPTLHSWKELGRGITSWLLPPVGSNELRGLVAIGILLGMVFWIRAAPGRGSTRSTSSPSWLPAVISALAHLAAVLITRALFDALTELNTRLLYPVAVSLLIAGIEYAGQKPQGERSRRVVVSLSTLALAAVTAVSWVAVSALVATRNGSLALNSPDFTRSAPIQLIVANVAGENVFTNLPEAIWIAGLDHARPVPALRDPRSLRANQALEVEMATLAEQVRQRGAVIYLYRGRRKYLVGEQRLKEIAGCVVVDDGTAVVLTAPESPWCPELH